MTRHILTTTAALLVSGSAMAAPSSWDGSVTVYNDENGPAYPADTITRSDRMHAPSRALLPEATETHRTVMPRRSESPASVNERNSAPETYFRDENGYYPAQIR